MAKKAEYRFIADYPCPDHHTVELDLTGDNNPRQTLRMMVDRADHQHDQMHATNAVVAVTGEVNA